MTAPAPVTALLAAAGDHLRHGRTAEALAACRTAARQAPEHPAAWRDLGVALSRLGDRRGALAAHHRALALDPAQPPTLANLGALSRSAANAVNANANAAWTRRAARLAPADSALVRRWAATAREAGWFDAAGRALAGLATLDPADATLWRAAGETARARDALATAARDLRRALLLDPEHPDIDAALTDVLTRQGDAGAAERRGRRAAAARPDDFRALNHLGLAHLAALRWAEAERLFARARRLAPDRVECLSNHGAALKGLGRLDAAQAALAAALALDPASPATLNNLGNAAREAGAMAAAFNAYNRAITVQPDHALAFRNLLPTLLYDPSHDEATRFAVRRRFGERLGAPARRIAHVHPVGDDPERRLRIGYLSADFRDHVVARNILPLFERHDRARFEVFGYAGVAAPDAVTARFQALADGWRSIVGLDDRAAADLIAADRVDILVSLAGHFDRNRPLICAYKPAPTLISMHDPATSGLAAMDYLIGDPVLIPRGGPERFIERPLRLPVFHLAAPILDPPDPGPPPSLAGGRFTFGSFNAPAKLSAATLAAWAAALRALPDARLLLKYRAHHAASAARRRIVDILRSHGVDPSRIEFRSGDDDQHTHLRLYREIDVALDAFPFNGATTTFEALSMGAPVATMLGDAMVGRWSAAMLRPLGLDWLAARDLEGFVAVCRRLAEDPALLAALRTALPGLIPRSALCDAAGRTRQLERLFRAVWRRRCRQKDSGRQEDGGR